MGDPRKRIAAFLDRDGTIIPDRDYTNDPALVSLFPGAARAIQRLEEEGYSSIIVTNQSGIARGLVSLSQYHAVRARLSELLEANGATLADTMTCPHHPDFSGACNCRKPAAGLYERAAIAHDLDLSRCLFVGDRRRDIEPSLAFHARAALVQSPHTSQEDVDFATAHQFAVCDSLSNAVTSLLAR